MTQLARVSEARKIELTQVALTVSPQFEQTGSIRADDVASRMIGVDTEVQLESAADPSAVAGLIATAERMCFLMDVIRNPHPATLRVTLNGSAIQAPNP